MASTIVRNLHNKQGNTGGKMNAGGGDMLSQFLQFKSQIEASGKDPQAMLNEMLASGKVSPAVLNKAKTLATMFANKFRSGR